MKYAQYLKALESDAPPEWRGKFIGYKRLKKAIKHLSQEVGVVEPPTNGDSCHSGVLPQDAAFFNAVHKEVLTVNRHFSYAARAIIRLSQNNAQKRNFFTCCTGQLGMGMRSSLLAHGQTYNTVEELVRRAEWCRRYAQINAVGLRKILKKHDKMCKNKAGHTYMQELWCGTRRMDGTFLHSPLLDELKSLETMLLRKAYRQRRAALKRDDDGSTGSRVGVEEALAKKPSCRVELPNQGPAAAETVELAMLPSIDPGDTIEQYPTSSKNLVRAPSDAPTEVARAVSATEKAIVAGLRLNRVSIASSGIGEPDEVDSEYQCPICLEVMYQPLGLECGHRFCADCAFTCVGKGRALGTVRAILDHIDADAACPECRTPGVFPLAMHLTETENLIKQRYPMAWAERKAEAVKKEGHLRELLAIQRMDRNSTFRSI